jgi:beta-N-acetylhexosaminidase
LKSGNKGMARKRWWCFWMLCIIAIQANAQSPKDQWVDSVFNSMSVNDKIGQLFMLSVSLDEPEQKLSEIENRVTSYGIGGIVYRKSKNNSQTTFTNRLQSQSDIPLLIGVEGFSGINSLSDTVMQFPAALALGAIDNDSLLFNLGQEIGREMKITGIHINFISANVATDSLSNANSLGENTLNVTSKTLAYWKGLQSQNVLACAKYFPIQAVRVQPVEKGLPEFQWSADSAQAYPFQQLISKNIPALMPSAADLHLFRSDKKLVIKELLGGKELKPGFAANWLREHTQYNGAIFIDLEQMLRANKDFTPGDGELFAFEAGNDVLFNSPNIAQAIKKFKKLFKKDGGYKAQLDASVKRILGLKYDAGLNELKPARTEHLLPHLATTDQKLLRTNVYRSAITVIKNDQKLLPVIALENRKYSCVIADDSTKGVIFHKAVSKYIENDLVQVSEKKDIPDFYNALISKQVILIAVFPATTEETIQRLFSALSTKDPGREIIICDFGSTVFRPYAQHFPTVVTAYSDEREMLQTLPEVIFGGLPARGKLSVSFGQIPPGTTIKTENLNRLIYSFPEEAGMDSRTLAKIESIAKEAIDLKATPGCHVLVARKGKVIYEKSFGHYTYEKVTPVTDNTIYDLASVTKVAATLQATMFMYEKGLIDINKKASVYLPELKQSNKKDYTLKDILTHQAGLWPFLPFWAQTMKDSVYLPQFYNDSLSAEYPFVVSEKLFAHKSMRDSLWNWIVNAKVREKPARTPFDYRYSDMGFYILQHLAEKMLNQPMDDFLDQNLYEPLGANTTGFLPLLRFPLNQIAPTENDKLFRKSLLIGTVHDQGAAMQGGIAGHAGLFSSANDLAKLGQMLLQEGEYGGTRFYKPETVRLFAQRQFASSFRGLGWNKPSGVWDGTTSIYASPKTFGHTGFTGTCIWIDPEFDLVYVFLSNRVHPDMTNNKLLSANIRSRIQDVIYQSIFEFCKTAGGEPVAPENSPINAMGGSQ